MLPDRCVLSALIEKPSVFSPPSPSPPLLPKAPPQELPGRAAVCRDHDVHDAVRLSQLLRPPALCGGVPVGGVPEPARGGAGGAGGLR